MKKLVFSVLLINLLVIVTLFTFTPTNAFATNPDPTYSSTIYNCDNYVSGGHSTSITRMECYLNGQYVICIEWACCVTGNNSGF